MYYKNERECITSVDSIYQSSDQLTIADCALHPATMCLEAIGFSLSPWPHVESWYNDFKVNHPDLWEISAAGMKEIIFFEKNPPDLSHMIHPIHPIRKVNK